MRRMSTARFGNALVLLFGLVVASIPPSALAGSGGASDPSDAGKPALGKVLRELQRLEADRKREDQQIKLMQVERAQDEKEIKVLETEVKQVEGQNQKLQTANQQLQGQTQELQTKVASVPSSSQFARALEGYSGTHQFLLAGGAAGNFIYDRRTNTNTFALQVEPILLYHVNDWLAFEATIKASFSPGGPGTLGSGASFDMPVATAQIFLNDYMELVTGIFDQPFGDFYETQGPFWVNRMITAPLPYGSEALITPTDLGAQLRGGLQWGSLGQDVDYTAWVSNGPHFTLFPQAVAGNAVAGVNNISINTHGKAFGGRIRVYPLPVDSKLGRLEVGASTYDGKYQDGMWLNSWGVDLAYHRGNLQARGEYLETYRQMGPMGFPANTADNRQGWYVQAGYFLTGVHPDFLGATLNKYLTRLEPIVRYSGVNQRGIVVDDVHAAQISPERFSGDPMNSVGYSFKAEVPGVYAYHCSAIPILDHIGSGMYGMMIVEPKSGWPNGKADEVTLVESEFYGLPDQNNFIVGDHEKMVEGRPDFVVFNGAVDKYGLSNPIPIKVGDLVRVFFVNAGPNLTSAFHVAGVLFSTVYRSGNPADALRGVNTLEVPPGDGAVFEFKVNQPGDYSFIDLNRAHQYKGAAGVFRATP